MLDDGALGEGGTTIGKTGVQEGALLHSYRGFVDGVEDGGDTAEVIVFFLEDEMNVDNLCHVAI